VTTVVAAELDTATPYVGPIPFRRIDPEQGRDLFGRDAEAARLVDLLVGNRFVLLYSPSGAGKTSLIEAKLITLLQDEGLNVLPTMRVGIDPTFVAPELEVNRYGLSALLSLNADSGDWQLSLDEYLSASERANPGPRLLILDQFEEVLVKDPTDIAAKTEFFKLLGAALRNPNRWVLVAMREDYVAALDPYLGLLPLPVTRFRLDLLDRRAARAAIVEPARAHGVDISPVAEELLDQLSIVNVQLPDGSLQARHGSHIEPMQLQVACLELWRQRASEATSIEHLDPTYNLNAALGAYYRERVHDAAVNTGVTERFIREWIGGQLITPRGTRDQVQLEQGQTQGLDNTVIRRLEDDHLVRGEERGGLTWFELAHDNLVEAVRTDNDAWLTAHLTDAQRTAALWHAAGRPDGMLLTGDRLKEAERWVAHAEPADVSEVDRAFLKDSRTEAERQKQAAQRRLVGIILAVLIIVAGAIAVVVEERMTLSTTVASYADAQLSVDPKLSLLLAHEAVGLWDTEPAREALRAGLLQSPERAEVAASSGRLSAAQFSGDGHLVAAVGQDGAVHLWTITDWTLTNPRVLRDESVPPPLMLTNVVFSQDGKSLLTVGQDQTPRSSAGTSAKPLSFVRVWDVSTGQPRFTLFSQPSIFDAGFTADGNIVYASADGVWTADANQSTLLIRLNAGSQRDIVVAASIGPDGSSVVTTSSSGTVQLWNATASSDAQTADSRLLATVSDPSARPSGAWVSPDGKSIVTADSDDNARVWDVASGKRVSVLAGHSDVIRAAEFSSNGSLIVTASDDGTARVWSTLGNNLAVLREHRGPVLDASFDTSGKRVVTAGSDGTLRQWTVNPVGPNTPLEAAPSQASTPPIQLMGVSFSPDGNTALAAANDGGRVWDVTTGHFLATLGAANAVARSASPPTARYSADGQHLVVTNDTPTAYLFPSSTGDGTSKPITITDPDGNAIMDAVLSADGRVLTATSGGVWRLWDVSQGEPKVVRTSGRLDGSSGTPFNHVVTDKHASLALVVAVDGTASLWHTDSGTSVLLTPVAGASGADPRPMAFSSVTAADLSPDGSRIVTGASSGSVQIWDARSSEPVARLVGHTAPITSVAFSTDGRWVLTSSSDGTARLWNGSSGALVGTILPGIGPLSSAALSTDDHLIAVTAPTQSSPLVYVCDACNAASDRLTSLASQLAPDVLSAAQRRQFVPSILPSFLLPSN
jgi:WD40 repeat protein